MARGRIGIITGSGPEAGIDLWTKVLAENRRVLGDGYGGDVDAPDVTIVSVPELGLSMHLPDTEDDVREHLRSAARRLADQVDVYAIACNTLYWFESDLRTLDLPAELVSPVDCLGVEAGRRPETSFALLGAGPVADLESGQSPYGRLRDDVSLELHPDPGSVHELIEGIKLAGGSRPDLESRFVRLVGELDADAVALACTELPLLAVADQVDVELLDVTQLLAAELVRMAGAPRSLNGSVNGPSNDPVEGPSNGGD